MRKKLLSVLLCTAMAATMLTGCGGGDKDTKKDTSKSETKKVEVSDGGKVFNIRVWNEEFRDRVVDFYPGYEKVDKNEGKIGDVTVKWTITPSDDGAYQTALDEALLKQDEKAADEKIDMFLIESDYAMKYVDTAYTVDMKKDIGVSDEALAKQYKYTQDAVTDSSGSLKGASWQACPAGMIYRRDIAKKVFGTDEPEKIQEIFKDWDAFKEASKKLKDAGYLTTASVNDTYRVFSNNATSKWVEDGKINVDANIKTWVDMSKEMVDAGETKTHDLWSSDWSEGFMKSAKVFCYFGPAWFIDFSMGYKDGKPLDGSVVKDGGWALTTGPQSFFWGGTWICGANGTDNKELIKDIVEKMTGDKEILKKIIDKNNDFVNHTELIDELKDDKSFGDKPLGGQNPMPIFAEGVAKIDLSNVSAYDQTCTEEFQQAMKDYFDGNTADYDSALQSFKDKVKTKHPEIKE